MTSTLLRHDVAATLTREHAAARAMRETRMADIKGQEALRGQKLDFRTSEAC